MKTSKTPRLKMALCLAGFLGTFACTDPSPSSSVSISLPQVVTPAPVLALSPTIISSIPLPDGAIEVTASVPPALLATFTRQLTENANNQANTISPEISGTRVFTTAVDTGKASTYYDQKIKASGWRYTARDYSTGPIMSSGGTTFGNYDQAGNKRNLVVFMRQPLVAPSGIKDETGDFFSGCLHNNNRWLGGEFIQGELKFF